ncbi:hypothetical protein G4O51_07685 [Candidatus Bathyarchaeota archaeon A05DMB-2]|jgi:hypothetical protein|nr:hypothetical protein [Candidatus Bathyarchaeota archaeon A05DMB-2]
MAENEILPQKIVDTSTIILKTRLDANRVKSQGEKIKTSLFSRSSVLKPKPRDILLVAFSKYYEPYILIGGKYSIDYCKKHNYALKVGEKTQEIFIDGKKLKPEPLSLEDDAKVIKLVGEEHSHYENETYIILDRILQEVSPDKLFFAPFESEPENKPVDFDLRKPQISLEEEINFLRLRIAKRPSDVAEIVRENFEINERMIIYNPVYELTYKNIKDGKRVTALINGITGEVTVIKFDVQPFKDFENSLDTSALATAQAQFFRTDAEQPQVHDETYISNLASKASTENLLVKEKANNIAPNPPNPRPLEEIFQFKAENVTHLATDFVTRLGYKQGHFPTRLYAEGENDVVEIKLQQGTARVQIDTKTKEVKEYEIQEEENKQGFFTAKRKGMLFLISSISTIAVVLKLLNIF